MAVIGVKMPVFARITTERNGSTDAVYGDGVILGKAMNISVAETYLTCSALADRKGIFQKADIVAGVTESPTDAYTKCFASSSVDGDAVSDNLVVGVAGGFGYITTHINNGVKRYCVHWLKRVVFYPPTLSAVSRGKSTTMTTESLTGVADSDGSNCWRERKFFNSATDAVNYLKGKAGIV